MADKTTSNTQHQQTNIISKIAITIGISAALTACANPDSVDGISPDQTSPAVQLGYTDIATDPNADNSNISKIRLKALEDTASSLGARGALSWRGSQINATLSQQAGYLDRIFNFNALMMQHNVVPPVLVEGDNQYAQDGPDTVRMSSKTYKILTPAHFASTPPTWRTYLSMNYKKPGLPDSSLLPKNADEIKVWNRLYKSGWNSGLTQADMIFNINLNRLKRDYNGIILYRKLYTQKMISAPYVSEAELGVTGDSNAIQINDRVLRITNSALIQTNSSKWQPILTKN